jgi:hypothetical protein
VAFTVDCRELNAGPPGRGLNVRTPRGLVPGGPMARILVLRGGQVQADVVRGRR